MRTCRHPQSGISLIMVLVLMLVIGLGSATVLRSAISDEQMTNNMRVQNLAQQYAEAALAYCEAELAKPNDQTPSAGRKGTPLEETNIPTTVEPVIAPATYAWNTAATWTGAGGASATKTVVPQTFIQSADSSFVPKTRPECVVEKLQKNGTTTTYLITARGFSPDYQADAVSGETLRGSVVWLQAEVLLE